MADHEPNRKTLTREETIILDAAVAAYDAERERARTELLAAQARYQKTIMEAGTTRDMVIMRIVDMSGRGTRARIAEHLGMGRSYLSARIRRLRATTTDGYCPGHRDPGQHPDQHTNTPTSADAEAEGQRRETLTCDQHREMPTDDSVSATGTTDPPRDSRRDHQNCVIVAHGGHLWCGDMSNALTFLLGLNEGQPTVT